MKRIIVFCTIALLAVSLMACSGSGKKQTVSVKSSDGKTSSITMQEFKTGDFSFSYPEAWALAKDGGDLDGLGGIGVAAVNSFDKQDYWFKPVERGELIRDGGGLVVNKLPKNGVYVFVMDLGNIADPKISKLSASAKPYGTPAIFRDSSFKITSNLDTFPKEQREKIRKKWTVDNNWLHYRVEFTNHGHIFDAHVYVLGNAVKTQKAIAAEIVKSFALVDPAK